MHARFALHDSTFDANGVDCPDSLSLALDLHAVGCSIMQGMPVSGAWFEARLAALIAPRLRAGLRVTGAAQICDLARPTVRSRSWDVVIYDPGRLADGLPPAASPDLGPPILNREAVRMVIDAKVSLSATGVGDYCAQRVFDRAKEKDLGTERQLDFLGSEIEKVLFVCATRGRPASLKQRAEAHGVHLCCLCKERIASGAIVDGFDHRRFTWTLSRDAPLAPILERIERL